MSRMNFCLETTMQFTNESRSDDLTHTYFTDPTDFYYRTIDLTTSPEGGYILDDGSHISTVEFENLRGCHPGDIVIDGKLDCSDCDYC